MLSMRYCQYTLRLKISIWITYTFGQHVNLVYWTKWVANVQMLLTKCGMQINVSSATLYMYRAAGEQCPNIFIGHLNESSDFLNKWCYRIPSWAPAASSQPARFWLTGCGLQNIGYEWRLLLKKVSIKVAAKISPITFA